MPVNLSIRHVPDKIVAKLKRRAAANHRSLQGELAAILEQAAETQEHAAQRRITVEELMRRVKKLGLHTPDEATAMIREDRDRDLTIPDMRKRSFTEICEELDKLAFHTESDGVQIIREMRDAR